MFIFITKKQMTATALVVVAMLGYWLWPEQHHDVDKKATVPRNISSVAVVEKNDSLSEKFSNWEKYKVQQGDNLYYLSIMGSTSVDKLMAANKLTSERLDIGQVLLLPPKTAAEIKNKTKTVKRVAVNDTGTTGKKVRQTKISRGYTGIIGELIPWEKANLIYSGTAKVIDLKTGKTFMVKRNGGHEHADSDPLTAEDTAVLKELYGGQWSWARRAIILEVDGRKLAASMNGMPHGHSITSGNDFPGHFCIHFLGSRTHGSEYTKSGVPKVDPDHQAMVHLAAGQ